MAENEYSVDEKTRKRGDESEDEADDSRSKKVHRSPGNDRQLEKILESLNIITMEIRELREEQKEYRAEMKELRQENEKLKQENRETQQKVEELENKIDRMEKDKRRNNIILQGVDMDTYDQNITKDNVQDFLCNALKVETKIKSARKIGSKSCLIELENATDKEEIMKNKGKLRDIKGKEIYINDDMDKNERMIQGKIRTKAKEAKLEGKNVKVGFQKIKINEEVWTWNKHQKQLLKIENQNRNQKN
uniref:DNA ligase 1-like n=1 Tax=Diabrotica virgifera virgifera TaxID=50390 RepID=A0A6P7FRG2_DIAVI